jgi:hypothetical protein
MLGRYIQPAAASGGDNFWYELGAYTSATSMALSTAYLGSTASTVNFTIGQVSPLPENYQMLPVLGAAAKFWRGLGQNITRAREFQNEFDLLNEQLEREYASRSNNPVIEEGLRRNPPLNPNLFT